VTLEHHLQPRAWPAGLRIGRRIVEPLEGRRERHQFDVLADGAPGLRYRRLVMLEGEGSEGRTVAVAPGLSAVGWRHFEDIYRQRVDYWQCFDNSGRMPVLLTEGANP
jgi:hypothetical protein